MPSASVNGSAPPQDSSSSEPRWSPVRAADGAGGEQVAGAQGGPVDRQVGQLLAGRPVHASRTGGRLTDRPVQATSSAESRPHGSSSLEVGSTGRVLWRRRARGRARAPSSGTTHGEIDVANDLPRNGPERHVLPRLDVPRRPVVDAGQTPKTWSAKALERHRCPSARRRTRPRSRPRPRCRAASTGRTTVRRVARLALSAGADDRRAGDDDRAGPAVVADRQVLPVRGQRR